MPGEMTPQWTIWCARCEKWDGMSGSKSKCKKEFVARGWKKCKDGFVCPVCQKKSAPINFTLTPKN